MKIFLISIIIVLLALVLVTLLIMYLRKIQYDAIHRGLISLEDKFGGKIIRNNMLVRPFYKSEIQGREVRVGFTSEKFKDKRATYVHYTVQCKARYAASIMHTGWYEGREDSDDRRYKKLGDGRFLFQVKGAFSQQKEKKLVAILDKMPDFAYILIAKTGIILERISEHLVDKKEEEKNQIVISGLLEIAELFEK